MCYYTRYRWIRRAFAVVICANTVNTPILTLFTSSYNSEFQMTLTCQKRDQPTCSQSCQLLSHFTALCYMTFTELNGTRRVALSASASYSQAVSNTGH